MARGNEAFSDTFFFVWQAFNFLKYSWRVCCEILSFRHLFCLLLAPRSLFLVVIVVIRSLGFELFSHEIIMCLEWKKYTMACYNSTSQTSSKNSWCEFCFQLLLLLPGQNPYSLRLLFFPFSLHFPDLVLWVYPLLLLLLPLLWNSLFLDWKQTPKPLQTLFFGLKQPFLCILCVQNDFLVVQIRHNSLERVGRTKIYACWKILYEVKSLGSHHVVSRWQCLLTKLGPV